LGTPHKNEAAGRWSSRLKRSAEKQLVKFQGRPQLPAALLAYFAESFFAAFFAFFFFFIAMAAILCLCELSDGGGRSELFAARLHRN
jgi:hypothetical protein